MKRMVIATLAISLVAAAPIKPDPSLGKTSAACRVNETGPALFITPIGLKDARGILRAELYPDNDADFLQDDAILINEGKTFRRVDLDLATATATPTTLCMRVPAPGRYTLSLLHDRDRNLKFSIFADGIGFSNNPKFRRAKPPASAAIIMAGTGLTQINITMNYLRGFSFAPLDKK